MNGGTFIYLVQNTIIRFRAGGYLILLELVGRENFTNIEYDQLYESITKISDHPIELNVRFRTDIVVTKDGPISFGMLKQRLQPYVDEQLKNQMENIIQKSL